MRPFPDPVTLRQLPLIAQIICDETWLEGERRGCVVSPEDPIVRENVCAVVLRIGRELRERLTAEADAASSAAPHAPLARASNDGRIRATLPEMKPAA